LSYVRGRPLYGRWALRITRRARVRAVERYIAGCRAHLDVGCGDGYLLRRSPAELRVGLDRSLGDDAESPFDLQSGSFDCVSMLAVIEHLKHPERVLREVHRVLEPGGKLVLTTPCSLARFAIRLYTVGIDDEHERYYDRAAIERLAADRFELVAAHRFLLGLNQAFCLRRRGPAR
jgi:2-polyprenyl-3-methyl-5-hydroxy-6-metoxy-1,4-benzoquinol methylase